MPIFFSGITGNVLEKTVFFSSNAMSGIFLSNTSESVSSALIGSLKMCQYVKMASRLRSVKKLIGRL